MVLVRINDSFRGFITVHGRRYCFEINYDESFTKSSLKVDWKLNKLLGSSLKNFLQNEFYDVQQFYIQFKDFVNSQIRIEVELEPWLKNPLNTCTLIKALQQDIKTAGEYIKFINMDARTVDIETIDAQFRSHKAVLKLNQGYPKQPVEILYLDLPKVKSVFNDNICDFSSICTVSEFSRKFVSLVQTFQEFWNVLSVVDSHCWVLDPPNPTYQDVFRRIKLSDTLSVGLTLNPLKPRQIPGLKLFGCQSDVNNCREILQKNLEKDTSWDCNKDLIYNISNMLDMNIPNKLFAEPDALKLDEEQECAICFMKRLNDELPNEVCDAPTCKTLFHSVCLFTYLSAFPKNREYFSKIKGECPNCDSVISCSVPKFMK